VGVGVGGGGGRAVAAIAAACALAGPIGCAPWRCDFESHGACVEFTYDPGPLDEAKARVDRLLDLELPYWGLSGVSGWRIQFRTTADYECYFVPRNEGCTDYAEKTLSVRVRPDALGCFEASELLHELGHYALGDPMHSSPLWQGVSTQFAPVVWDRPDAPAACVARYHGLIDGGWSVNANTF
jgi:hypothetical protein